MWRTIKFWFCIWRSNKCADKGFAALARDDIEAAEKWAERGRRWVDAAEIIK